jgi:hypothetical protein
MKKGELGRTEGKKVGAAFLDLRVKDLWKWKGESQE